MIALINRVAIVTGASSGIGRATALLLRLDARLCPTCTKPSVLGIARGTKGRFFWRNNSVLSRPGAVGSIAWGRLGAPDIIGCVDGKFVGLEVKTRTGKLNEMQQEFSRALQALGGRYHVVRSIDGVQALGLIAKVVRRNLLLAERVPLSIEQTGGLYGP